MSGEDAVKETKATKFQLIVDKLEFIEKKLDELLNKPRKVKNYG